MDPKHTVVLVIDPQKGFAWGMRPESMYPKMVANLIPLLEAARKAGVKVVYAQNVDTPHTLSASVLYARMRMYRTKDPTKVADLSMEGSEGVEFIDAVKPRPEDFVVKKHRNSAFEGTGLDMVLRNWRIRTLIITGCQTDGCVESTARGAYISPMEYFVVVAEDCVASFSQANHDPMMKVMKNRFDVVDSKLLIDVWNGKKKGIELFTP